MRICIIGNSHTGALKRAWDNLCEKPYKDKYKITIFASAARSLDNLVQNEGILVPNEKKLEQSLILTSGGLNRIDLDEYDIFLLYGLNIKAYFLEHNGYSKQCLAASVSDTYNNEILGFRLMRLIRNHSNAKIYLGHEPLKANETSDRLKPFDSEKTESQDHYTAGIDAANKHLFSSLHAVLLEQPKKTRASDGRTTLLEYANGSSRLHSTSFNDTKRRHSDDDVLHMNDLFGKIWIEKFLSSI